MSRYNDRRSRDTNGHGAAGFLVTLILILLAIGAVFFFFSDGSVNGIKGKVYGVFYPQKYSEQVEKYAQEFGVEEALVYAVIRTESGFRPEVESHAGAVGLMQLMPSTFDWLQEKLDGGVIYGTDRLTDPDVNVRYGTYLLSYLVERYDGDVRTAAAAYNAGTSNVDEWLADVTCTTDGKTLTRIPFEETSAYVDRVEKAREMYSKLYD